MIYVIALLDLLCNNVSSDTPLVNLTGLMANSLRSSFEHLNSIRTRKRSHLAHLSIGNAISSAPQRIPAI